MLHQQCDDIGLYEFANHCSTQILVVILFRHQDSGRFLHELLRQLETRSKTQGTIIGSVATVAL